MAAVASELQPLYCGVALAAVLAGRLDGHALTPHDGWMAARERVGIIAAWTLLVCTVGAALRLIERYVSAIGLDTAGGPFSQSDLQAPFGRSRGRWS